MPDWLTKAARGNPTPAATETEFDTVFWPGLQKAFAHGLSDEQVATAMTAARAESLKWFGRPEWQDALAAIVGAAFRAVSDGMGGGL